MEITYLFLIFLLSLIFGLQGSMFIYSVYNLLFYYNKYYFILLLSMVNWSLFNFQAFLFTKIFGIILLFIIHTEKITSYYKNLRNMMDINTNIKKMDIIDDEIIKEIEEIEYINDKLIWIEKKYNEILALVNNIKYRVKKYIEDNYNHYFEQLIMWSLYFKDSALVIKDHIEINLEFILDQLCQYEWIDYSVKKIKKYEKIYSKINIENEEKSTKFEDISKMMNGLNDMMNLMASLPKLNDQQKEITNANFLSSITDKIPFKIPDAITEKIPFNFSKNNTNKKRKKNKKK